MMRSLLFALALGLWLTGCQWFEEVTGRSTDPDRSLLAAPAVAQPAPQHPPMTSLAPPRPRREKPLLIMLDLRPSGGVDPAALDVLSQRLWATLLRTGDFLMIARDDVGRLLSDRGINVADPYSRPLPMRNIGHALTADFLVFGTVGRIGNTYTLDAQMLNVAEDRVIGAGSATSLASLEGLIHQIPAVVRALTVNWEPAQPEAPEIITVQPETPPERPVRQETAPPPRPANVNGLVGSPPPTPSESLTPEPTPPAPAPAPEPTVEEEVVVVPEPAVPMPEPVPAAPPEEPVALETPDAGPPASLVSADDILNLEATTPTETQEPPPDESVTAQTPLEAAPVLPEIPVFTEEPPSGMTDLDTRIQMARERMVNAIMTATNPYGSRTEDSDEAARLMREAANFPPSSPLQVQMLEQALALDPRNPDILALTARAYLGQENPGKAIELCHLALRERPQSSMVYTVLGSIHHTQEDYIDAIAAQERALEADPNNHYAQYNLALSLWQEDHARGRRAFERFVEMAGDIMDQQSFVEQALEYINQPD